jgi:Uncharacterized membrane protein
MNWATKPEMRGTFQKPLKSSPIKKKLMLALTLFLGAIVPLIAGLLVAEGQIGLMVALATQVALAVLGGLGTFTGGANLLRGAARVFIWGTLAMAATAAVGALFGVAVA